MHMFSKVGRVFLGNYFILKIIFVLGCVPTGKRSHPGEVEMVLVAGHGGLLPAIGVS